VIHHDSNDPRPDTVSFRLTWGDYGHQTIALKEALEGSNGEYRSYIIKSALEAVVREYANERREDMEIIEESWADYSKGQRLMGNKVLLP
jgi:hypothetical protein